MRRNIITVPIRKVSDLSATPEQDLLAVEEPLQIRIGERNVAITMRTPGNDAELAVGFLFSEGILQSPAQISDITAGARNIITVTLAAEAAPDLDRLERHFYLTSSCGVCGKASIEALESIGCPALPRDRPRIELSVIHRLPDMLRTKQMVFDRTGGLHAAALFDASGELLNEREDVGRHNAVDKLVGAAFLKGHLPLNDNLLMLSGRASFELVQKALMAGIPVLAAVGAPSSLAVELALRFGMTLLGFVRDRRFNIYSGESRLISAPMALRP
jgi:FdhD protein